jgi:hypothetical protein
MPARSTPEAPRTQAADTKRHRDHFRWLEAIIAAADISATARLLGVRLALHHNVKTGRCFVGYAKLAAEIGIAERSAMRAVAELERRGWITVHRGGGRGHANTFRFSIPSETVTGVSGFAAEKGDTPRPKRVTGDAKKGDRPRQETVTGESPQYEAQYVGAANAAPNTGESDDVLPHVDDDSTPGVPPADAGPPQGEGSEAKRDAREAKQESELFAELQAIYRRPWGDGPEAIEASRVSFEVACREVAPERIIEAARKWVAAADAPRFLQPLPKWLNGRCFEHDPPTRPPSRRTGAPHHKARPSYAKPDLARMMLAAGRA